MVMLMRGDYMEDLKELYCSEMKYNGLNNMEKIQQYNLKRNWSIQRKNIKYDIEVTTLLNRKKIIIKLSRQEKFDKVFGLLCEILRYECLFDGQFFSLDKIEVDGIDVSLEVGKIMLSYYSGERSYTILEQPMNDSIYKRGFCAWERYTKKTLYINQLFFYLGFCKDFTSDVRIALFSEIYEPLSEMLADENKIQLIRSNQVREIHCRLCGGSFEEQKPGKTNLKDRVEGIIRKYGEIIFDGDDVSTVSKKIVNTRNKILHVNAEKRNALDGGQCGFYMIKLVDLYRIIVLCELRLWNDGLEAELQKSIEKLNEQFQQFRIKG